MLHKNQTLVFRVLNVDEIESLFLLQGTNSFIEESEKQILKITESHTAEKNKKQIYSINTNFIRFLINDLEKFVARESKDAKFIINKGMFKKEIKKMLQKNQIAFSS